MISPSELRSMVQEDNFEKNIKKIDEDFRNLEFHFLESKRTVLIFETKYDDATCNLELVYYEKCIVVDEDLRNRYVEFFTSHGYKCSADIAENRNSVYLHVDWNPYEVA